MIKTGDRVRFLDATGGGVVTRFIKKDVVGVLDEDGFEVPVLVRECVVVEPVNKLNFPVGQPASKPIVAPVQETFASPAPAIPNEKHEEPAETEYGNKLNIYLAFLPSEIRSLAKSRFELFLINDSNYYLAFTYLATGKNNMATCRECGEAEPDSKVLLEIFDSETLRATGQIGLQAVAFKKRRSFEVKPPVDMHWTIPVEDFGKMHLFADNEFFDDAAMIVPLIEKDIPASFVKIDVRELQKAMSGKDFPPSSKPAPQKKSRHDNGLVEIDLHINELLETTAGMDNAAMLEHQMDTFRQTIETYKNKKGQKIVFIHGKGDGILRNKIREELKARYKNYHFQDASFREYGFGATMVTIR
jgi:hypothetical protein